MQSFLCLRQRVQTTRWQRRSGPGSLGRGRSRRGPLCFPAPRWPRRVRRPSARRGSRPRARKPPAGSTARAEAGLARPPQPPSTPRVNSPVRPRRGRPARLAVSSYSPPGPARWRARPRSRFVPRLDQRVRPCVCFAFGARESLKRLRQGCGSPLISSAISGPLLLRSPAQNSSHLPRKPNTLKRACFCM